MRSRFRYVIPLCMSSVLAAAVAHAAEPPGYIDNLEIVSTYDAYGGASFGTVGRYTVIVAIAHGKLNPLHPANAGIVDLKLAPRDANGLVSYSDDVVILRPKSAANAKRVLWYDVVNRGNKVVTGTFNNAGATFAAGQQGDGLLLRQGYTIVWSGWQGNVAQTGHGDTAAIGTSFPVATNPDGSAITGQTREEFILDSLDAANAPGLDATTGLATVTLTYPAASLNQAGVTFNWRQTWKTSHGMDFNAPSTPVPSGNWSYVNNGTQVQFRPPPGTDLGSIYEFIYTAKNPKPNGIGFAAVRDLVTFLNHDKTDHRGNANPVADLKYAPCEQRHCSRDSNFEVRIIEGISQSGRFTRDFLYQGFNYDGRGDEDAGKGDDRDDQGDDRGGDRGGDRGDDRGDDGQSAGLHAVFNGAFPIIPASRKTYTNFRWSQPFRWSKEHEDHWQPGDQFPFGYNVITDPLSGRTDGILRKCMETNTCPKIIQLDGGFETFGGRGALVTTDLRGHDLKLPDNVRLFVVPGANHGGGGGVAALAKSALCQYTGSAVVESTIDRALAPVLVDWVAKGISPPASMYPSFTAGTAAPVTSQSAVGFPDLSSLGISYPAKLYNELAVTRYAGGVPMPDLSREYTLYVSKTDADGNELAGVRVPDVVVPLATYTSWNYRAANHAPGDLCSSQGSTFLFASTKAQRTASGDPRPSLQERYASKADYVGKVQAAAQALVAQRLLLDEDVKVYVNAAQSQTILP